MDYQLVLTTCPDEQTAHQLAEHLIREHLAACVSCLPGVRSFYEWEGKIERAQEVQLLIKTRAERYADLEQAIRQQHPYEVPELIALPITAGLAGYLEWIDTQVNVNNA